MLLELSEWQVAKTSLSIPSSTSKRRKSSSSSVATSDAITTTTKHPLLAIATSNTIENSNTASRIPARFSFVPHSKRFRPSKRKKNNFLLEETIAMTPTLAVTTHHSVCVLGTSLSHLDQHGIYEKQHHFQLQEIPDMMYTSRPGNQSSFFPRESPSSSLHGPKGCTMLSDRIPALVDAQEDRVYALQGHNKVLVSWKTSDLGPDSPMGSATGKSTNTVKSTLPQPALSMNLLSTQHHGAIVYGTLSDSRVYIARWFSEKNAFNTLVVECPKAVPVGNSNHVCTVVSKIPTFASTMKGRSSEQQQQQQQINHIRTRGYLGKRKSVDVQDDNYHVTQVFVTQTGFFLLQHHLVVGEDYSISLLEEHTLSYQVRVVSDDSMSIDPYHIKYAHSEESMVVAYVQVTTKEVINGKKQHKESRLHKACHVSLLNGVLLGVPFDISESARQIGLVSPILLAASIMDAVLLYDITRGALLRSINVSDVVSNTQDWEMISDHTSGCLALLTSKPNGVDVARTVVTNKLSPISETTFHLADGLRAAMVSSHRIVPDYEPPTQNLLMWVAPLQVRDDHKGVGSHRVQEVLASLHACLGTIVDPNDEVVRSNMLLDAYEAALAKILPHDSTISSTATNGHSTAPNRKSFENDTLPDRGDTPSTTPQQFIDGAVSLILATLQLPIVENKNVGIKIMMARLDARLILYRLIRSGKVSARRHFQLFSDWHLNDRQENGLHDDGLRNDTEDNDDVLLSVLRATKLTNKRGKRVVSPVDIIHEMLSNCADLTERHLVTMIHYFMCKALPHDIAENLLGWKCFDAAHQCNRLSKSYFRALSTERKLQKLERKSPEVEDELTRTQETIEQLSTKLLKVGLLFLVERVTNYSKVNASLLRIALTNGLIFKGEAPTLARILVDVFEGQSDVMSIRATHTPTRAVMAFMRPTVASSTSTSAALSTSRCATHAMASAKWIYVLCEACRDILSRPIPPELDTTPSLLSSKTCLEYILHRLGAHLEETQHILSLRTSLESIRGHLQRYDEGIIKSTTATATASSTTSSTLWIQGGTSSDLSAPSTKKDMVILPTKLAAYCIEQLLL